MSDYPVSELNKVVRGPNRASYDIETINSILDAGFIAQVSYIYKDQAISIPMAYGRMGNILYLHGSLKNRMLLGLLESGKASMTIMHLDGLVLARSGFHHSVNYRSATLFGSVKRTEEQKEKEQALRCVVDHMIPGRWDSLRPMSKKEFNGTLVLKFQINTASAKIRAEGVNDEKADHDLPIWAGVVPIRQIAEIPEIDSILADSIETPQHVMDYYDLHKA